jgi:hypothetical protein
MACTCVGSVRQPFCAVPPIQAVPPDESAVFVGNVLSVTTDETKRSVEAHLKLEERFQGNEIDKEVVVFTGIGDGDCGVRIEAGASYLVVAYRASNGLWGTDICSRTQRVASPAVSPEIKALRVWRDNQLIRGWVFGLVVNIAPAFRGGEYQPMDGVVVRFRAGRSIREARTDG